jgi:FtsH-binding integral membrane protein
MDTSEIKPASRRARCWARLSDPDQWPRGWWFPPSSRREAVLQRPEAARQEDHKEVQQAHEKFSETVRLAMLSLLGFALFCLLITFSAPDSTLLVADPTIKMPFADVQVSFQSFLILAPFLLIVVTLYLHIFYGYWLDLEMGLQHLAQSRQSSEPPIERLPTLFSLDHPVPRLLTAFIFYWLVPLVLVTITWKAAARLAWGLPLACITSLVAAILVFLQIRRCPTFQRQRNRRRWVVMALIGAWLVAITFNPRWLERPLNIFRADLQGQRLVGVNLHHAYAHLANFQGADLQRAKLQGANLREANLQRVNLWGANLRGANLWGANLRGANLGSADLQLTYLGSADLRGVNLWGTNLRDADLQGTDLQGADLRGVIGLSAEQLQAAQIDGHTQLPDGLQSPSSLWGGLRRSRPPPQ